MSNESKTSKELEDTLRPVIQSLIDGQEGFKQVGEHLQEDTIKRYCLNESLKRASLRGELENLLHSEGVPDVKESGTVTGAIHRTWGDLKAYLGGGDHALLITAEQAEDAAKAAYADALAKELPLPVHQLLSVQFEHIRASHDYVKAARDARQS